MSRRKPKKSDQPTLGTRRFIVWVTAICPVEIPFDVADREASYGMLDHEIWERFERRYREGIALDAIRETQFYDGNGTHSWTPVYRRPPAIRQNRPLNAQDTKRNWRAVITGCDEDALEPPPPSKLPF